MDMVDYAVSYVNFFHAIMPVGNWTFTGRDGKEVDMWKRPLIKNWSERPLMTAAEVRREWKYWENYHRTPGIGLATGQICGGYIVIDLDRKPETGIDGYEILRQWERENGLKIPETWTAISGGGGYHLYFHTDQAMGCYANFEIGVDLRADGGMIVLPPSPHPSGRRYQWEIAPSDMNCTEADETVLEFIRWARPTDSEYHRSTRRGEGGERKMVLPPEIPDGGRHNALISLIGIMNRYGASDETIESAVRIENELKCLPPLTETELQREIFPAIYRWEKGVDAESWQNKENWKTQFKQSMRAQAALERVQN